MRRRGWIPSAELVALLRRYALVPEEVRCRAGAA